MQDIVAKSESAQREIKRVCRNMKSLERSGVIEEFLPYVAGIFKERMCYYFVQSKNTGNSAEGLMLEYGTGNQ